MWNSCVSSLSSSEGHSGLSGYVQEGELSSGSRSAWPPVVEWAALCGSEGFISAGILAGWAPSSKGCPGGCLGVGI